MSDIILQVNNLSLIKEDGTRLIYDISFQLKKGEILGIFGQSGSGKSLLCKSLMNLYPKKFQKSGEIYFIGKNISDNKSAKGLMGAHISLMFQNVQKSLNPLLSNGKHLLQLLPGNDKFEIAERLLHSVGFANPKEILKKYPSHLSGGELSRFGLCLAIANEPDVLILDEAFASIDNKLHALFEKIVQDYAKMKNKSIILVTHNPEIITQLTDRVIILENGKIIETLESKNFYTQSQTKYLADIKKSYDKLYL